VRLVGIQPMTGDHLEWQLTVPPGPEEQEASILLNLRAAQDPKKALRGVLEYNELAWLSPTPKSPPRNLASGYWIWMSCEGSSPITSLCPGSRVRYESSHPTPPCR
jgi:hypothetical protein